MKTEDILTIEESSENRINLVRDRLFWQAWNRSAFLFVTHIKKYHVHKRFVQKVSQEVTWLGFPKNVIPEIERIAKSKGWSFEQKSADHIIIGGVPQTNGYEKWWAGVVKPPKVIVTDIGHGQARKSGGGSSSKGHSQMLPAYKIAYDLCINVHIATAKMPKEFRYELGARVRNVSVDIVEKLHLMNVGAKPRSPDNSFMFGCAEMVHKLRLGIRILSDLRLIGLNQWGVLNQKIEDLLNCIRAEFRNTNPKIAGAALFQSSGALPPEVSRNAGLQGASSHGADSQDAVSQESMYDSYWNFSLEGTFP
jgi:hypothetical protein